MIFIEKKSAFYVCAIAAVCFFSFFANNLAIPADYMESRNLATAQEMVSQGNFLVPTMNGDLRLEKPPLPTWISSAIEIVSPDNLRAQRAAAGMAATAMVVFLFLLVARLTGNRNAALLSALVCATSFSVVMMGRTATWDIYCHAFMMGAILSFVLAVGRKGRQWGLFILSGIFIGLSFLSKGPVSLYALLLPFLAAYLIAYRPSFKGKKMPVVIMIVIAAVVSLWWYGYLYIFHTEELRFVLNKESGSWLNHNVRPFYYYWQFPAEAGIWAVLWVTSIIYFFVRRRSLDDKKAFVFSIIWMLGSLLLLSLMPEKKTRYLLPLLVPGAMNTGLYFYHLARNTYRRGDRIAFRLNAVIIVTILFTLPAGMYMLFVKEGFMGLWLWISVSAIFAATGIFICRCLRRGKLNVEGVFTSIIVTMAVITGLCMIPIGKMFVNEERHSIRELRYEEQVEGLPFYYDSRNFMRMELVYESNRIIKPINLANDSLVRNSAPFVLITTVPVREALDSENVTIEDIGVYDNNWRKRDHKRYNKDLVSYTSIIRPAERLADEPDEETGQEAANESDTE